MNFGNIKFSKNSFAREMLWLVVCFCISVAVFAAFVAAGARIDRANQHRQQSLLIADELRQSSDDLTRMARTYVVSGDPLYKQHYQEILDIRNGIRSRPVDYQSVYWDLVLEDNVRPRPDSGQKISLLDMMRQAGFTQQEFDTLASAKINSDMLTQLEMEAMQRREVTKHADQMREQAENMLHDARYHHAKAAIMRPLAEFETLVDGRTKTEVRSAERLAMLLLVVMIGLIGMLIVSMWRTYRALVQTLGSNIEHVKNKIENISTGKFSAMHEADFHPPHTVAGWLNVMQQKLQHSYREQQNLSDILLAEKERAQVTLACIGDAVMTTDAQGRVTFLNQTAIHLTGWSLAEANDKLLTDIFNIVNETTRQPAINPVHQVLAEGKTVSLTDHTVLIARDGTEYNIEDSAAPIYLKNGELLGCVLVFHDVTEKHRLLNEVSWQAGHDALTGLPNRALLADRFERALASVHRQQECLAVCILDLDDFKPVNDSYGHAMGDRLLMQVAKRLTDLVRAEDTVARMGGDEFVLLLGALHNQGEAETTLHRVLLAMITPYLIDGKTLRVSASIGVAFYPLDHVDPDTLLRHADQAMYQAKRAGRNRYHFFSG